MTPMDIILVLFSVADVLIVIGVALFIRYGPDLGPRTEAEQQDWTW